MIPLSATEVSGLVDPTYPSAATSKKYVDANYLASGVTLNAISANNISGGIITTNNLTLNANTISGLINPIWPSAASNKNYIDTISGNLNDKIDAVSDTPTTWGVITTGTGIDTSAEIGISGAGATLSVDQGEILSTVSSNAKSAYDWTNSTSGQILAYPSSAGFGTSGTVASLVSFSSNASNLYLQSGVIYNAISTNSLSSNSAIINTIDYSYPPITYSIANVKISANHNINLARFETGSSKSCYIYQAYACNSGCVGISGLKVEVLDDGVSIYSTSSQILQQGAPLANSDDDSSIEIRFMYSGETSFTGHQFGTAMLQVGVY